MSVINTNVKALDAQSSMGLVERKTMLLAWPSATE